MDRQRGERDLTEEMREHPYRFQFFQLVRCLRAVHLERSPTGVAGMIGGDAPPREEFVRFRGVMNLAFPPAEVSEVSLAESDASNGDASGRATPIVSVAFMGLYGAGGVLPLHDRQRILHAGRRKNVEREFLDVFNHRAVSLFFRAWMKYHLAPAFEATYGPQSDDGAVDTVSDSLMCLAGLGVAASRGRQQVADETLARFAGHFSRMPPAASSLEQMLASLFGVGVRVEQFVGQWLNLDDANQSRMLTAAEPFGQNCALGESFILGERVWSISDKFRVVLGPLTYAQMQDFFPGTRSLTRLAQLVRSYVGPVLDFDVQLELLADEVPEATLQGTTSLGINSWVFATPRQENACEAIYAPGGWA